MASGLYLGDVPVALQDLTFVERVVIARGRNSLWNLRLHPVAGGVETGQRFYRGNINTVEQDPSAPLNLLPMDPATLVDQIRVVFVGHQEDLANLTRTMLTVWLPKIKTALTSLRTIHLTMMRSIDWSKGAGRSKHYTSFIPLPKVFHPKFA